MKRASLIAIILFATVGGGFGQADNRLLLQRPTVSQTQIAFVFAGDLWIVGREGGEAKQLTTGVGIESSPYFSPDGKWIAFTGQYDGNTDVYVYYTPLWSPDSKKIAYRDKRLNIWYVEVEKGAPVKVDTDTYEDPFIFMTPAWSPDSRWIGYAKQLKSHLRAVFVYSLESGKTTRITDGMSDAQHLVFTANRC